MHSQSPRPTLISQLLAEYEASRPPAEPSATSGHHVKVEDDVEEELELELEEEM